MTKTGKTILLAVVGLVLLVGMLVVSVGVWFFTSAIETVASDDAHAMQSFADVRARFAGVDPVMRMTDQGPVLSRRPPDSPSQRELQAVNVIAWDSGDEEVTTVTVPFWLARMNDGPINVSASSVVPDLRLSITVEELERYGPAILIDHREEDGSRVLIWTE